MTAGELREKYLKFFESKGHAIIPSASLVPENDPTTLFTSSGMQPMIPYLMGEKHPLGSRITDSQKSFRSDDIEDLRCLAIGLWVIILRKSRFRGCLNF